MTAKKNDFLFNGIERVTELDLGWDLAHFRAYDPAIGRWLQIDPKTSERESPYVGFANMPNFYIDPLGDTIKYGNYTINNFWDDTYMGRDLSRIGGAIKEATWDKFSNWVDGLPKESTTEQAKGRGVTIEGETAGADSEYAPSPDQSEENPIMEQEFLDGVTAGAQALKVNAPLEWGESVKKLAEGVDKAAKGVNKITSKETGNLAPKKDSVHLHTNFIFKDGGRTKISTYKVGNDTIEIKDVKKYK